MRTVRRITPIAAFLLSAAAAHAQTLPTAPSPPRDIAIRNARIVQAAGRVVESGTIVLKNGLITAVGASVPVPADAWVIDGAGLTVYPGLVNALSTVGLPASLKLPPRARAAGPGGPGGQAGQAGPQTPYSWGPEDRPATTPWVNAADELNPSDQIVATWRNAGFTTAVVAPERGFFPGQAAVASLAGQRASDMVVRTPVALRINFDPGPGHRGYPNSLMGVIAYVKQIFSDAAWYDHAWTIYNSAPAGLERPAYDRTLDPLRETLKGRRPVLFPANQAREIDRVFQIAQETNTVPIVYGAQEGYAKAGALGQRKVPVLVNVDWPARDPDGDPDAEPTLQTLRFRDRAPTTPMELEKAGVTFAFYDGGLTDPQKFLDNVRKSVGLGLTKDGALKALTANPAQIFGVADRLGTLDAGKIANLVVTDGDLFQAGTKVKYVIVDGRKYEPSATVAEGEQGGPGGEGQGGRAGGRTGGPAAASEAALAPAPPVPMTKDRGPIQSPRVMLIKNATVMTVTRGTQNNASVLVRDGKISAIGPTVTAPSDALVIDATGKFLTPGIIDAHSHIASDATNEGSVAVSAMVGIQDVLDPDDVSIYRALAGGVTTVNVLHGSANPIGGKNAVIKLRWGADAAGLLFQGAEPGIKFALGENPKRDREPDRYPATRMGVMDVVREAFVQAREYQRQWKEYEAQRGQKGQKGQANLIPPRRDLKLETLAEILDGKRLVHAHSYRADEILQLIRLAEEFNFKIATFQHVLEGYKVADEIAQHGAGASTFSDWWAYKVEAYDAIPYNAALMTERGVVASINSDSGEEMRHLNQEAGKAMHWGGLTEDQALALVTLNPAKQLHVESRVGSIDVGKDADLVIFENHPLGTYALPVTTIVDGQIYFDRRHDLELRKQLEAEKKALLDKEKAQAQRPRVTTDNGTGPREEVR